MLRILALTDFSSNAYNALKNALLLARSYSAEVIFMHVMAQPIVPATSPQEVYSTLYTAEREKLNQRLITEVRALYSELGMRPSEVQKKIVVTNGPITEAVLQIIKNDDISILVAGDTEPNSLKRFILGSTTSDLIQFSPVPILITPESYNFSGFKNIAVVVSLNQFGYRPGLKLLARFAFTFASTIDFLTFLNKDEENPLLTEVLYPKSLQEDMREIPFNVITLQNESKEEALRQRLANNNYDMMVWLPNQQVWWGGLFTESFSEEIAHEAKLPLLIIPNLEEDYEKVVE